MSMPLPTPQMTTEDRRAADQVWNWLMLAPFSVGRLPEPLINELAKVATDICAQEFRDTQLELSRLPQFRHFQLDRHDQTLLRPTRPLPDPVVTQDAATPLEDAATLPDEAAPAEASQDAETPQQVVSQPAPTPLPDGLINLMQGEHDHLPLEEWRVQMRGLIRSLTAGRRRTAEINAATEAAEVALEVQRFERLEGAAALAKIALQSGQMQIVQAMNRIRPDTIQGFVTRELSLNFSPRAITDAFIALALTAPNTTLGHHPLLGDRPVLNEIQPVKATAPTQNTELSRKTLAVRSMLNQHFAGSYNAVQSLGKHQGRLNLNLREAVEHILYTRTESGISLPTAREVDGVELLIERWLSEQQRRGHPDVPALIGRARPAAPVTTSLTSSPPPSTEVTTFAQEPNTSPSSDPQASRPVFSDMLRQHLSALREHRDDAPVSSQSGLNLLSERMVPEPEASDAEPISAVEPVTAEQSDAPAAPDPMLAYLMPNLFAVPGHSAPEPTPAPTRKERRANNPRRPSMVTLRAGTHSAEADGSETTGPAPIPARTAAPNPAPTSTEESISIEERQAISERREAAKLLIHEMETYMDLDTLQVRLRTEQVIEDGADGHRTLKLWRNGSLAPSEDEVMLLRLARDLIVDEANQHTVTEPMLIDDNEEEVGEHDPFAYDPQAPTSRRKREEYILALLEEHGPQPYNRFSKRLGVSTGKMIEITKQITGIVCQGGMIQRRDR